MKTQEACDLLGIEPHHFQRLVVAGRVRIIQGGNGWAARVYCEEDVRALIDDDEVIHFRELIARDCDDEEISALPVRAQRQTLINRDVSDARAQFPTSTLADIYDADVMPPQLRKAHRALDDAVDKLYRPPAFTGDRDRVEHLFGL